MSIDVSVYEGTGFGSGPYGSGPYGESPPFLTDQEDAQQVSPVLINLTGVSASAEAAAPRTTEIINLTGVSASAEAAMPETQAIDYASVTELSAGADMSDAHAIDSTSVAEFLSGADVTDAQTMGPRTFIIAGIQQTPIATGIVILPTSEDLDPVSSTSSLYGRGLYGLGPYGGSPPSAYVVGSSQFYTIGQVYWNGVLRTEGTDWEFVPPFTHIIKILVDPASITTQVRLIYFKWDIGIRTGFKVTAYPVPFAFTGTSIVAERVPPPGQFFTLAYTSVRSGNNPVSIFARYPNIVDDMLSTHTLYDGSSGFETYRPAGYKVFDQSDSNIYAWDGAAWNSEGQFPNQTKFYVKRLRQIWLFNAGTLALQYTAGDGPDPDIPEVLTYPPFGESIGKNLLADAFSPSAPTKYPSAYVVGQRPGVYDEWIAD